ncbi:MAG: hypothetical protein RR248_02405 [Clostridia bacterium]
MTVVITLCLIAMFCLVVFTLAKLIFSNRANKLAFLKSFQRGKFVIIYIVAIPLFLLGLIYDNFSVLTSILLAIQCGVELVVLKFSYDSVVNLMQDNLYFCVAIYTCYVLAFLNAIMFSVTLFGQNLSNYLRKQKIFKLSKKVYIVVGYNKQNLSILDSVDGQAILFADMDQHSKEELFIMKKAYKSYNYKKDIGELIKKSFGKFTDKSINVIVNTNDDHLNLILTKQLSQLINDYFLQVQSIDNANGLNCYIFGEPENSSAFIHFVEKTKGRVHYVNKYKLISMSFVEQYPLTQFMDEQQIDYQTATIKENVEINVALIGFGKTNQQLFLTSVANNQFLTISQNELVDKPVNYYIYDKENSQNDKNLNHTYFRYSHEYPRILADKDNYLDLPSKSANEKFEVLDVNDQEFYASIFKNLTSKTKLAYNYLIIAFGSDLENLDLAEKITSKLFEWEMLANTKIFVKIRDDVLTNQVVLKEYAVKGGFFTFGAENSVVYNVNQIVNEKKELMAKGRHLSYAIEDSKNDNINEVKEKALNKWYVTWNQAQRESNIYACLSIKSKLQLLGFDIAELNSTKPDASVEYMANYSLNDAIVYNGRVVNGKQIVDYGDCNFVSGTPRNALAVQEHLRWNAYMLCSGYIPATISDIELDNKSLLLEKRVHANLTTFKGLLKYREIISAVRNCSIVDADVIKYDYQLMDDIIWLLNIYGYKIVKR